MEGPKGKAGPLEAKGPRSLNINGRDLEASKVGRQEEPSITGTKQDAGASVAG